MCHKVCDKKKLKAMNLYCKTILKSHSVVNLSRVLETNYAPKFGKKK